MSDEDILKLIILVLGIIFIGVFGTIFHFTFNLTSDSVSEDQKQTEERTKRKNFGDNWLGLTERFIGFISAWLGSYVIIIGWFAFKVASKWENWRNIAGLTDKEKEEKKFEERKWMGGFVYRRFLIGTAMNVIIGIVSFKLAKFAAPYILVLIQLFFSINI